MNEQIERSAVMNLARRDARDKLRGLTQYTIDHVRPGTLHAFLLRSEVSSARILRIDTSQARKMPGVRAIATAEDAPGFFGIGIADHPLFAREVIRYDGEPIAAIASAGPARPCRLSRGGWRRQQRRRRCASSRSSRSRR